MVQTRLLWRCPKCKRYYGDKGLCVICKIPTQPEFVPSPSQALALRLAQTIVEDPVLVRACLDLARRILPW